MKDYRLTIIATFLSLFMISMFAFKPTATKANNTVFSSAIPNLRKISGVSIPTPSPVTRKIRTKNYSAQPELDANANRRKRLKASKNEVAIETIERKKRRTRRTMQYNPKEVGVDKIKSTKKTNFTSAEGRSMSFELRRKQPKHKRAGKRQHLPCKAGDCK